MTRLTDETLMLFADGLLDEPESKRVGRLAAEDPDLRDRLNIFHATGHGIARLFDGHVNEPVPARLQAFLAQEPASPGLPAFGQAGRRAEAFSDRIRNLRALAAWNAPVALAASLALVAGIGFGWLLRGGADRVGMALGDFVQVDDNRLLARGALARGLESAASGGNTVATPGESDPARIRVRMTFRNEAGDYCRQYEIAAAPNARHSGVACRADGQWVVAMQTVLPPSRPRPDRMVLASGSDAAMEAAVGAIIAGDPLGRDEEAAIIRDGWSK
jgi:anti-sigma factor RsiW